MYGTPTLIIDILYIHNNTLNIYDILCIIIILCTLYIAYYVNFYYFIIMLYIDMLSVILHDICIYHYDVFDIYRNSCILLFNLYMQYHYIAFVLILLEYFTSSYSGNIEDVDTRHQEPGNVSR